MENVRNGGRGSVLGWLIPVLVTICGGMVVAYVGVIGSLSAHDVRISTLEKAQTQQMLKLEAIEQQLNKIDKSLVRIEVALEERTKN